MEKKYIASIIILILVILFAIGSFVSDQAIDVAGCSARWKTVDIRVGGSDLCTSSCVATPADQQHNAIVDAIVCACQKAKSANYADDPVNSRVEEVANQYFGYTSSAKDLCEQQGLFLVKRSYD